MITPILETERILLRPLKISDADDVFYRWASDPEVAKYVRWNAHQSVDETIDFLKHVICNYEDDKYYEWGFVLKETGRLFGSGGIYYVKEKQMFELGYVIMKKYWNKGLTTEAAKAIVDFALNVLKENSLHAKHAKENPASGRVMEKAGFVYRDDGEYASFDGKRLFQCRNYYLTREQPQKKRNNEIG